MSLSITVNNCSAGMGSLETCLGLETVSRRIFNALVLIKLLTYLRTYLLETVLTLVLREMCWSWCRSWSKFVQCVILVPTVKWSSVLQLPVTCSVLNVTYMIYRQSDCFAFFPVSNYGEIGLP